MPEESWPEYCPTTPPRQEQGFAIWWMAQKRKSLAQLERETESLRPMHAAPAPTPQN